MKSLRAVQLRIALARLERCLQRGQRADSSLLERLTHGWGNEAWCANPELLAAALEWFGRTTGTVLECGSGVSTLALAAAAALSGRHVVSLEHDPFWTELLLRSLPSRLADAVTMITAPLGSYGSFDWYSVARDALPASFGFVLCDGPPGSTRGGRYGLAPVMADRLDSGCIVLVDDTQRDDDRNVVERWCLEFHAALLHTAPTYTVLRMGAAEVGSLNAA